MENTPKRLIGGGNLRVCDTTVEGLANTVVLAAPAKRMRSFSLSAPSMRLEEETPKRPPEDSFSCVSVDNEIVDQGEATEGRSCQMLGVQHESRGMRIPPRSAEETSAENLTGNISHNSASKDTAVASLTHFQQIIMDKYPDLKATLLEDSCGSNALEITHNIVHHHPPAGYVHRIRITLFLSSDRCYFDIQVLFVSIKKGVVSSDEDFVELCNGLLHTKGFVFCPGIDYKDYHDNYHSVIRFHSKQVNLMASPFQRVDAKGCLRWYKLPKNATLKEQASHEVLCSICKRLLRDLEHLKKKISLVSPGRRFKRQSASSNYPTKFLSPASLKKRKTNAQAERSKDKALLSKYSKLDITLDDSQHDDMSKIVAELEMNHKDQLEAVYAEAGDSEHAVRDVWETDKRSQFYKDQIKNGNFVCICLFMYQRFLIILLPLFHALQ